MERYKTDHKIRFVIFIIYEYIYNMVKTSKKYAVVTIKSVKHIMFVDGIEFAQKGLLKLGYELFILLRECKYYDSMSRNYEFKTVPILYEYAFIELDKKDNVTKLKNLIEDNPKLRLSYIGVVNNKEDIQWIQNQLSTTEVIDFTGLGEDYEVGDIVRIINGPFKGYTGVLKVQHNWNTYIIDIGIELSVAKNNIRSLEYGSEDNDNEHIISAIR